MAAIVTNIPTKTSVERKPRDGYRFTIDIGTVNAWQFDLGTEEFEEFLRQVTRAHGPVQESCVITPEPSNKPSQASAPQSPPTGNGRKSYYDHPTIDDLQAIDVIQDFSYNVATAIAYLWRWGRKPSADLTEDGFKAIQHIEFEIKRMKAQKPSLTQTFDKLRAEFGDKFNPE